MGASKGTPTYLNFSSLWTHRALVWHLAVRNVEIRHRGSHLGIIWFILNPLVMLSLYVFVFGFIMGGSFGVHHPETKVEYALAVFLGLSIFNMIAETLGNSPHVIVSQPNFVKKVVFPLEVLPLATVAASVFHFFITLGLIGIGMVAFQIPISSNILFLPAILLPLVLLCLGIAWLVSSLGVFFRDLAQVTGVMSTGLMFASAVFYPLHKIPASAWTFLRFNPILHTVELMREAVLWGTPLSMGALAYVWVFSLSVFAFGFYAFMRLKGAFADVL